MSGYPVDRNELFNFDGRLYVFEHEKTLKRKRNNTKWRRKGGKRSTMPAARGSVAVSVVHCFGSD